LQPGGPGTVADGATAAGVTAAAWVPGCP